jgi:hypothetical protein
MSGSVAQRPGAEGARSEDMSGGVAVGRGRTSWVGLGLGLLVMGYGFAGLVADARATRPSKALAWLVGADLLHDLVFVPIVLALGWVLARIARGAFRWPVRAGAIGTALTVASGWIPLRGYGRLPDNPSLAPLDYHAAVVAVIAGVWCACALWAALNVITARRARCATRTDG